MASIVPVILCGGSGTRLWPVSRESYPKQFVDMGNGETLFGRAVARIGKLKNSQNPVIVCNDKYRFYVRNELLSRAVDATVILEPAPRNTAPAAALAALGIAGSPEPDRLMLVLPSDHHIPDKDAFCRMVEAAAPLAEDGNIITFGIEPSAPATGFGYIRRGEAVGNAFRISEFVEKPGQDTALQMLEAGDCYWNAGIFLLSPQVYLEELKNFSPDIYRQCLLAWQNRKTGEDWVRPAAGEFLASPEDSIDYAVMEHTSRAMVAPMSIVWDDLGSWEAFYRYAQKDARNNATKGDVILREVSDSYIRSDGRLIVAMGVSNLAVIETKDAVLVAKKEDTQKIKDIVAHLKKSGSMTWKHHPLVYRPWGSYETLAIGHRFQVKRIIVRPGEVLSLQMHHHRAEHWIVVSGTAEVTVGGETTLYTENQSTYIPIGVKHRLRNPGIIPLVMIEIQSGAYLGEDDIVRFEDVYGR